MNGRGTYPPPEHDWWRSEMGIKMCRKCGEDRLTHIITDGWGSRYFCQVCSHDWKLDNADYHEKGRP